MNQFAHSGDKLAQQLKPLGITNQTVLNAISSVPRHLFVDQILAHKAYENTALPIGQGQTISQPYICLLYTSPSPRDGLLSRMPSSA